MPPAAGRERGVIKLIKCTTTPAGFFVSYDYAFISPDSGPESPDVFLHATDVGGLSHRTSPKTGAALQSTILIDSHGVKQLIADFLDETRRLQAAIDASDADETKAPS